MVPKNAVIVIGGQYGSEAKGKHIQDICHMDRQIKAVVRTGAPNAGHSVAVRTEGQEVAYVAMQIIPCGWTAKNVEALYVGAGAQIIPEMLQKEYDIVRKHGKDVKVYVDGAAMIQTHHDAEDETGANMSGKVGSTSKGCGTALMRRISRNDAGYMDYGKYRSSIETDGLPPLGSVATMLSAYGEDQKVVIEGTQGVGLSLYHGPYPFCTSRDTGAANWLAEAGMSPFSVSEIHMVCRTFPIRVAGNSGPMSEELCWSHFFKRAGLDSRIIEDYKYCKAMYEEQGMDVRTLIREVCATMSEKHGNDWQPFADVIEFTTVTKLPRRIARFDYAQFERAVMMNRPTHVALEFCNYVTAHKHGITQVTPLMAFVAPVEDAPQVLHGEISQEEFNEVCNGDDSLVELMVMIGKMDEILKSYGCGRVSHLGISRNATLKLV